jgi:hypothetical protein
MWKTPPSRTQRLRASLPVGRLKLVLLSIALRGKFSVSGLAIQVAAGAVVEGGVDVNPHLSVRIPHVDGRGRRFRQSKIYHQFFKHSQLRRRRRLRLAVLRRRCVARGLSPGRSNAPARDHQQKDDGRHHQVDVRPSPLPLLRQPLRSRTLMGLYRLQPLLSFLCRTPWIGLKLVRGCKRIGRNQIGLQRICRNRICRNYEWRAD